MDIAGRGQTRTCKTIGGNGLARLYDVDFRNVVNKLAAVKKAGGRAGTLPIVERTTQMPGSTSGGRVKFTEPLVDTIDAPAIEITPAIREAVLGGQALFQGERGRMRITPDRQVFIDFLKDADLSTFLHETGHLYLEVLGDIVTELGLKDPASLTSGQLGVQRDFKTILAWLGVASRDEITTEHHEKFARGYEAYLLEGKAPSVELRGAFARFSAWLTTIYKTAKGLNVELSPTRSAACSIGSWPATRRSRRRSRRPSSSPLFATAEDAGMTPEEFALYRQAPPRPPASGPGRASRRSSCRRCGASAARPTASARRPSRTRCGPPSCSVPSTARCSRCRVGEWPDGTPMGAEMKLSKDALVAGWGEGILAQLPKPWVYTVEDGLEPDAVAELFGFSSGDELVKALIVSAPSSRPRWPTRCGPSSRQSSGTCARTGASRSSRAGPSRRTGTRRSSRPSCAPSRRRPRTSGPSSAPRWPRPKTTEREKAAAVVDPLKAEKKAARETMWAGLRAIREKFPLDTAREVAAARIARMRCAPSTRSSSGWPPARPDRRRSRPPSPTTT